MLLHYSHLLHRRCFVAWPYVPDIADEIDGDEVT